MSRVDQKSTPREAGLVVNSYDRNAEASRSDPYELEEGLESAKDANRIGRRQLNVGGGDLEVIRLVLAELLDRRTRSRSLNYEVRQVRDCLAPQRDPRFPRKCIQEALLCSF